MTVPPPPTNPTAERPRGRPLGAAHRGGRPAGAGRRPGRQLRPRGRSAGARRPAAWWSPAWASPAIVARKIAATLASTGTPALFVHPAEASHGDLGMIVPGDAVLALSNSGETAELADLVAHSRRFGLPLVAITARAGSTLAAAADVALTLPAAAEACPMGLAPTTSTTMQMALGDAHRGRPADPPRLHRRRLPPDPSRRPAGHPAPARPRPDARAATRCRSRRPTRRWTARCC